VASHQDLTTQKEKRAVDRDSHPALAHRLFHMWRAFPVSLSQTIEQWFAEAQSVAQLVAPMAAFLGMIGLGVMYMGSSWPIISQWKQDNPRAANQVVVGLLFVIAASTVASLISFS